MIRQRLPPEKHAYHGLYITASVPELSCTLALRIPLQIVETTVLKHDRPIGKQLEDKRFILVGNREYFSIEKINQYVENGQDFIFRIKDNIQYYY
ncbi:hypothetical protein [Psychrobacillus sp. OK032]|uniref:hypothetical protein n=1 Tax=Psychrobacillus sp. OK032 TaxID=1884358 RepID=UPI0015A69DA2|nr:hypothetical protein [Psychrobacillus sp. OK032]